MSNRLKFEAARKWCLENGFKFIIMTEDEIQKPTFEKLNVLKKENKLKFLQRYEEKFNEWRIKHGK